MKVLNVCMALGFVIGLTGCGASTPEAPQSSVTPSEQAGDQAHGSGGAVDHSVDGHAHGEGPHGGTIADWGGGTYHVEFTVDHVKRQATVYVLGSDEKTAEPIGSQAIELAISDPEMQVTLAADPQEGDPDGKASRFVATNERLGVVQEYAGTLTGVVDGTPYSGDFTETADDEH